MYVDVPEIQRCCYCVPARHGLLVWIYIKLMVSFVTLIPIVLQMIIFYSYFLKSEWLVTCLLAVPGLVLDIIMNIVALVGGHTKKVKLLQVYYKYSIFSLILFIISYIVIVITDLYRTGFFNAYHPYLWNYVIWYMVVGLGSVVLQTYMLLLLRSKVHKIKSNCKFRFVNHAAEAEAECAMDVDQHFIYPNDQINRGLEGNSGSDIDNCMEENIQSKECGWDDDTLTDERSNMNELTFLDENNIHE